VEVVAGHGGWESEREREREGWNGGLLVVKLQGI
jgi:hypothetical protein